MLQVLARKIFHSSSLDIEKVIIKPKKYPTNYYIIIFEFLV